MAAYSLLIKGGMVARNKKLERLDVGIENDKIKALGDLSRLSADLVIDASGYYVSPGFIDLTSHSDTHWTLFNHPSQESLLAQGVTTILGGNCGSSLAPLVHARDIEGIQKWVDIREINVNWHRVSEFFEELSRHPLGLNFATLVGHGTLRRGIIGDEARPATAEEIKQMQLLLEESLEEGAFGISTSLGAAHGRPADIQELTRLHEAVAAHKGLSKHHLKDEGKNILPAIAELLGLARASGARTQFSHFKILGRSSWPFFQDAVRLMESGREEGLELSLDIFPFTRTGSQLYQLLPVWAVESGKEKILGVLKDQKQRNEVFSYLKGLTLHYDRITIASTLQDQIAVGKTIQELSLAASLPPEEIILKLLENNKLKVSIFNEVISEEHLFELIKKEYASVASDGVGYARDVRTLFDLPHPRSYSAFPHALEIFTKERSLVSWPEILHKMTELPAQILGLKDRGRLEKDCFADLVVLNPEEIEGAADWRNPYLPPRGVEMVFVNGKIALDRGNFTNIFAGRVLRKT